jgi:hypothetical protein
MIRALVDTLCGAAGRRPEIVGWAKARKRRAHVAWHGDDNREPIDCVGTLRFAHPTLAGAGLSVRVERVMGEDVLVVPREALRALAEVAACNDRDAAKTYSGAMPFSANSFFALSFFIKCVRPMPRRTLGALVN